MSDDDECRWNCPFCGKVFETIEDFDGHTMPRNQPIFGIPLCRFPKPDTLQTDQYYVADWACAKEGDFLWGI
jgi:hypothetical protein